MVDYTQIPQADQPTVWLCRSTDPSKPGLVRLRRQYAAEAIHAAYAMLGVASVSCEPWHGEPDEPRVADPKTRRRRARAPALRLVTA